MPYSARYSVYLGHNVHVVMRRYPRFWKNVPLNNDDLFRAIFYLSGPQCMRCYAGFPAVLEVLTTNNDDLFRAIYYCIGPQYPRCYATRTGSTAIVQSHRVNIFMPAILVCFI